MTRSKKCARGFVVGLVAALAATAAMATSASAATTTFSNPATITIPDSGTATPYPSTITAAGLAGNVQKATVTLRGFNHTCPNDLAVLLVGPSGANSILMSGAGGCPGDSSVVDLTFDQASGNVLNDSDYPASGTYRPSQNSKPGTLSSPAPAGPYPVDLNVFNGNPANGTWSLFVEDQAVNDQGAINGGWQLHLNAPVNTVKAGKPKLNKKNGTAQLPVTVGDAGQLTLRGKGVKSASASKAVAVTGPSTKKLTVKAKGKTLRSLNSTGSAKVKVTVTFTPTGGTPKSVKKKIKLKKTLG
jgi:subtilisin-like proprotein convertase family protein